MVKKANANKKSDKSVTKITTVTKKVTDKNTDKLNSVVKRIKLLSPVVTVTPNDAEWVKFLDYIQKRMLTFDIDSDKYIDYEQRNIERNQPVKKCVPIGR